MRKKKTRRMKKSKHKKSLKRGGSRKYGTLSFITYGDHNFSSSKERILNEAKEMGCFDGIIKAYGPEDLSEGFKQAVGNVLNEERGGGYWTWRPYIFMDIMSKLKDNDIFLYTDAGCVLQVSGVNRLKEYAEMISPESGKSVLCMRLRPYDQKSWTTDEIFKYFNEDPNGEIGNAKQVLATIQMYRKCPESMAVIQKFYDIARTRPDLFTDKHNEETKRVRPEFADNRHDQSIFSMLVQTSPYNKSSVIIEEEIEKYDPINVRNNSYFITKPLRARRLR